MNTVFLIAIGIGIVAGLRSLTAPAVVAWAAYLHWLGLQDSAAAFIGSKPAVIILTILAFCELLGDKWPRTPKRTALAPLMARIVTGALCGACVCVGHGQSLAVGAVLGGIGGLIGAFAGYQIRRRLVTNLGIPDAVIAVCEDLVAIGLAIFLVRY